MTPKRKGSRAKISLYPQHIGASGNIWYYENRGNIEIFVHPAVLRNQPADKTLRFKIPKYRLERSLRRMRGGSHEAGKA
jgi:hypothetical protein